MAVAIDSIGDTISEDTWVYRIGIDTICGECAVVDDVEDEAAVPTLSNALILWPILYSGFSVRVITGGTTETLTVSLTSNRYYWMAGDAQADADGSVGGVGDLLRVLQTLLNTNTGGGTYSVTLTSSFFLQVTVTGVSTFRLLWADGLTTAGLGTTFGFSGSTASAATATGTLLPAGIWRPGNPFWKDTRDREPTVGGVATALSGLSRISSLVSSPKKERSISFLRVRQEVALREFQTSPTSAFEYAWVASMKIGRPFRVYGDETTRTSTSYGLYRLATLKDPLTRSNDLVTRWDVDPLDMRSVV